LLVKVLIQGWLLHPLLQGMQGPVAQALEQAAQAGQVWAQVAQGWEQVAQVLVQELVRAEPV
jgi:hypothetical protein